MMGGPEFDDPASLGDEDPEAWREALDADAPPPIERLNGHHVRVDDRPEVKMGKDMPRVFAELSEVLARDPLVYQRSHELVTIVGAPAVEDARPKFAQGAPVVRALVAPSLVLRLQRHAKLIGLAKPTKAAIARATNAGAEIEPVWVEIVPPPLVTATLLAGGDWPHIRTLVGISETPFMRPDGSIHQARGYDEVTGFLYAPACEFPPVADEPTQDDARAALADLTDVFREFPHVSEAARAVPIAAILTLVARPAIHGSIPAFIFDAATRGSGKTLQAHAVSLIADGRVASPCTFPDDDDELEKVLGSYAIAGARIVLLDNVTRPFGGAPLDKVLTSVDTIDFRVLGRSHQARLPWTAIVMASGNNITLPEDTLRRSLVSRLVSPLENPEDREDLRDLPSLCRENRPALVAAALTLLRAYTVHGSPNAGCRRWGSFEAWSRLIPHAIKFAGGPDVMDARPKPEQAAGDELGALATVLRELPRLSLTPLGAKAIVSALWPPGRTSDAPPDGFEDLRDAIESLCPPRMGQVSPKALGERLRKATGRVIDRRRLRSTWGHNHLRLWSVDQL